MKKRNQRNIALRCFIALVLFLGVSIAAVAQDIAYITKNVDGVTGAQYCIEYKKVSTSNEWYANAIYTKGLTNDANAAAITFSIDGGSSTKLNPTKFSTSGTTYSANVTQLSVPTVTPTDSATVSSNGGISIKYGQFPEALKGNFAICLGESSSTRLERPYNVEMKGGFTTINKSAFYNDRYLRKFIVKDGDNGNNIALTTIKTAAFMGAKLTEFTHAAYSGKSYFPSAIKKIENTAFGYSSLTGELNLPSTCATVEAAAFCANNNLTKLDVRNEGGPAMVIGIRSFAGCPNLETVELSAKEIGDYAFYGNLIKHLTFREGVEKIGYMAFRGMESEDDMILPSTLKVIGDEAFGMNVKTTGIPGWIFYNELKLPAGLQEIGKFAFAGMRSIQEKLIIPDAVKKIGGNAFMNAPIKHLEIGSGVEEFNSAPFFGCAFLETVIFKPNTVLKSGSRVFTKCNSLRYVRMDAVESTEFLNQFATKTINKEANGDTFFGQWNPYTIVYLPKNFTDMNKLGSGVNDVNFVFYNGGNYTAPKFVVYDNHANYRTYDFYSTSVAKMRVSPRTGAEYIKTVDSPVLPLRGCDYEIPVTFTAQKASYNRTFSNPSQFYTVSLPYSPSWTQETMSR